MISSLKLLLLLLFTLLIISCESANEAESKYNPPSDHTINKDGIMHKTGLNDPQTNCVGCHGSDLRGSDKAPSCYSCHGKKW